MAHSNFSKFDSYDQWQQELNALIANANNALMPTGTPDARQAANIDLSDFRYYPCPFDDLRSLAQQELYKLALADIGHALGHLQSAQQQLLDDQQGLTDSGLADTHQPVRQARRALTALQEVSSRHPEVAKAAQQLGKALDKVK